MKYAALCSGIGGLELAVEAVFGGTLAWHAEHDQAPASIHERHWPGVPNIGDLTAVDWGTFEPVDLICAGYPCQPFSSAGARRGVADDRHLWPYVAEAVRSLRPRWVVLENVAGHLSLGFGRVLGDLAEAGYDTEWCSVRASDVGAPHGRLRVFVVAADTRGGDAQRRGRPSHMAGPGRAVEGEAWERQRSRDAVGDRSPTAADTHQHRRQGQPAPQGGRDAVLGHLRGDIDRRSDAAADTDRPGLEGAEPAGRHHMPAWGPYEPAVRRWERLTRPAPAPTDERGRLSATFVEWMMGYPEGWTDGLRRNQQLKAIGNAVCPQQGAYALRILADAWADMLKEAA